ncbi:MAG TPA: hypothetical protein VGF49_07515, partial [Candidatus Solibacter sp.]
DPEATQALEQHYMQHIAQLQQKKLQAAIIEQAVAAADQMMKNGQPPGQPGGVLAFPEGLFGPHAGVEKGKRDTTTIPSGNPASKPPGIYPAYPAIQHEQ